MSLPIEATWGDESPPTTQTVQPLTLVRDALSSADAWSASMPAGESSMVVLAPTAGSVIPAHPLAVVSCQQEVVPLGLTVTHVGNQPLAAPATVDVTALRLANAATGDVSPVTEPFAAAQFLNLTDDQALSRPSFEPMRAGLSAAATTVDAGNATVVAATYKTVAVDGTTRTVKPPWLLDLGHAQAVLNPAAPPPARPAPPQLALLPDTLRTVAGSAAAPATASLAAAERGRSAAVRPGRHGRSAGMTADGAGATLPARYGGHGGGTVRTGRDRRVGGAPGSTAPAQAGGFRFVSHQRRGLIALPGVAARRHGQRRGRLVGRFGVHAGHAGPGQRG